MKILLGLTIVTLTSCSAIPKSSQGCPGWADHKVIPDAGWEERWTRGEKDTATLINENVNAFCRSE